MIYIKVLAFAAALFIVLKSIWWFLNVFVRKSKARNRFLRFFPIVEVVLWFSYFFWAFNVLFYEYRFYIYIVVVLIIAVIGIIGWYLLRDIIAGIILRADNAFEPGQRIITSIIAGTIKKLGLRSMRIINSKGEDEIITYTRLINENIKKPSDTGKYIGSVINLRVDSKYPAEIIQNMIFKRMLEIPWIVSGDTIKIRLTRDNGHFNAEIHYQSISPEMALKTEENLQNFVNESFIQAIT